MKKIQFEITTFIKFIGIFFLLLASPIVQAHEKVVIVPLLSSHSKPLKNIVTVAKANGDFSDPVAAVSSINDASVNNPYLIIIAPGEYTLTEGINMKEFVSITGSGENVTVLKGAISSENLGIASAIVQLSSNATLSNLTIKNTGGSTYSIGIYSDAWRSCSLENITITAMGTAKNYGIYNRYGLNKITNVSIMVSGGNTGIGIFNSTPVRQTIISDVKIDVGVTEYSTGIVNDGASPTMNNVTITATGNSYSCGVFSTGSVSSPTMVNSSVTASGEAEAEHVYGIRIEEWASFHMSNVSVSASGGVINYGLFSSYNSLSSIRRSTLSGDTYGLMQNGYDFGCSTVSQSTITNGVGGDGHKSCVACDNGAGIALANDCN